MNHRYSNTNYRTAPPASSSICADLEPIAVDDFDDSSFQDICFPISTTPTPPPVSHRRSHSAQPSVIPRALVCLTESLPADGRVGIPNQAIKRAGNGGSTEWPLRNNDLVLWKENLLDTDDDMSAAEFHPPLLTTNISTVMTGAANHATDTEDDLSLAEFHPQSPRGRPAASSQYNNNSNNNNWCVYGNKLTNFGTITTTINNSMANRPMGYGMIP